MTPKLVVRFDPKTFKPESFRYDDPGPVPPIIDPPEPNEPKDGGLVNNNPVPVIKPEPKERNLNKPKPS